MSKELDLTTPEGVVTLMKSSRTEKDWNNNCDSVKKANNGYPDFWYKEIVASEIAKYFIIYEQQGVKLGWVREEIPDL